MDQDIVYTKTASGEDAVRQPTRVVQRNQRVVLVQVDGKTPLSELAAKIGSVKLVEDALRELENGGFIAPLPKAVSVWERGKRAAKELESVMSRYSSFGARKSAPAAPQSAPETAPPAAFSAFGKPILAESGFAQDSGPATGRAVEPLKTRRGKALGRPAMLSGFLLLVVLAVFLFPYDHFRPRLEAGLQGAVQAPVRIGSVTLGLLPRPALTLGNVDIDGGRARIEQIRLPVTWSLFAGGQRTLAEADILGIDAPLAALALLMRPEFETRSAGFVVRRAVLQRFALRVKDRVLPALEGEIFFSGDGRLERLRLQTADRSLQIAALPAAQGVALTVEGHAWKPQPGQAIVFDSLQAKGLLQDGKLILNDIDAGFLGGVLKGNWLLDWSRGMAMAGEASLTRLDLGRVMQAFAPSLKMEGELDGHVNLRARGADWNSLWANVEATLDADASRGTVFGVDFGEAARRGVGQGAAGGATRFDSLRARLDISPQAVRGEEVRMEAGLIAAKGRFIAHPAGRVDGAFDLGIRGSAGAIHIPIRVGGTLPNLVVTASR